MNGVKHAILKAFLFIRQLLGSLHYAIVGQL